ncbi:MAG: hypothetical protein Q7T73_10470 [Beijerinckiaceae bacterium]|nr:hypothetical protein [Beijerinckiaceae bacterium]
MTSRSSIDRAGACVLALVACLAFDMTAHAAPGDGEPGAPLDLRAPQRAGDATPPPARPIPPPPAMSRSGGPAPARATARPSAASLPTGVLTPEGEARAAAIRAQLQSAAPKPAEQKPAEQKPAPQRAERKPPLTRAAKAAAAKAAVAAALAAKQAAAATVEAGSKPVVGQTGEEAAADAGPKPVAAAPAQSAKPAEAAPAASAAPKESIDQAMIARYCTNFSSAASEGRLAWQAKQLLDIEAKMRERIVELEAKRAETAEWLARREESLKKAEDSVVAIYSKMRPEAAAAQFSAMDESGAAAIMLKLNPRLASTILNEIEAGRAARIAAEMAGVGVRRTAARSVP